MTTELEKQFFDTFGIEPKKIYLCPRCKTKLSGCTWVGDKQRFECLYSWGEHPYYMGKEVEEKAIIDYEYPQITDRQYLELICAYNNFQNDAASFFIPFDYKNIKNNILTFLVEEINAKNKNRYFCNDVDKLKHQVQAIFEVERWK